MALSLLLPGALALGALLVLPLLAHLTRQTPSERMPFGAMLLLERMVRRLRRRRRVTDPWLLLLRSIALLALVFAAAGARLSLSGQAPEFGRSGRVVIVLDRSLSMSMNDGGGSLLARARADAIQLVEGLPEGTLVGAVAFGSVAERLVPSLTTETGRVVHALKEVEPGGGSSDLRAALVEARGLLAGESGEVLLFSDEAGPRMVPSAQAELERLVAGGSVVIPRSVQAASPRNVAVTHAAYGEGLEGGQVTVRVSNFGSQALEVPCEVTLPDGAAIPIFVEIPPEGVVEERITVPPEAAGGVGRARCEDPDLAFDNDRYFHLPRVGASRVLVVDGDPGDTPTRSEVYFLDRALAPWGGSRSGVRPEVITPAGLSGLDPQEHRVVFFANVADPRPFGPRLVEFVRGGGSLVISGGDNVTAERYNAALGAVLPSPVRAPEALASVGEEGIPVTLPDASVELFEPFVRVGRQGFGRVRVRRLLTLEPYEDDSERHTLLRLEGGLPVLVERRVGAGTVLLWTSTLDLGWTNLPLQSVFMPLVQRVVTWLGAEAGLGAARFEGIVGESVVVPLPDLTVEPGVLGPDGRPVRHRIEGSSLRFEPEVPGAYELVLQDGAPMAWVAVNVSPDESDVRHTYSIAEMERELEPELFRRHVTLAPWLLGLALSMMALQAVLSTRRRSE